MDKKAERFNWVGKLSECLKKIECTKWYMAYMQELLLQDIEKKEPHIRQMLMKNKEMSNIYQGRRCFILGSGPSLNKINFQSLSNEIVFTVNQLPAHNKFQELHSNYHIITDLQAFGLRYDKEKLTPGFTKYSLTLIKSLAVKGAPTLIVPYQAKGVLQRAGITDILKIRYICSYKAFIDGYHSYDLTGPISNFPGVVLTAILCALYMGFSKIYLLGCEQTAIIDMLECALGEKTKYGHSYDEQAAVDDEGYHIMADSVGIKNLILNEYRRHEGFEQLYYYCREKGVQIYNLTNPSLVSGIPRRNFEEVIKVGN